MQFLTPFDGGPQHGQKTRKCEFVLPAEGGCYRLVTTERFGIPVRYEFEPGKAYEVPKCERSPIAPPKP